MKTILTTERIQCGSKPQVVRAMRSRSKEWTKVAQLLAKAAAVARQIASTDLSYFNDAGYETVVPCATESLTRAFEIKQCGMNAEDLAERLVVAAGVIEKREVES